MRKLFLFLTPFPLLLLPFPFAGVDLPLWPASLRVRSPTVTKFAKALRLTADGGAFWTLKTSIRSLGSPCVMVGEVGAEGVWLDTFSTSITGDLLRGGEV